MNRIERLAFLLSFILLLLFLTNLIVGTVGSVGFLEDVEEAIVLFGTCIAFVIAVLISENRARLSTNNSNNLTEGEKSHNVEKN